ncbi:class II glutamine amidotransferase [Rhizobium sp. SL86]|uniref:class II glutamine amidotransferase n=1 Tax=Rhizobium sp. SL86 TaxID=2995148 RepID=UPI0022759BFE|nr:class II glutamine amidotransferase [Rhizobium sp. SL86]MCY1667544.1 class II glutamine amidotransferase [Rhizobium sp. SL86]
MCRFAAYSGPGRPISYLAIDAPQAIQRQSCAAFEGKTRVNGDGFGLGWYDLQRNAFLFRDTNPAWADENFEAISRSIVAPLYFVHCRAATGTETARSNCHPFRHGTFLFMHNGQIGGYGRVRRSVESLITDELYGARRGTSDSEAVFLAAVSRIDKLGIPGAIASVLLDILTFQRRSNVRSPIRFSAVLADGETLWAFRWASDCRPPSLYTRSDNGEVVVASEPIDQERLGWTPVPAGSLTLISKGRIIQQQVFDPSLDAGAPNPVDCGQVLAG